MPSANLGTGPIIDADHGNSTKGASCLVLATNQIARLRLPRRLPYTNPRHKRRCNRGRPSRVQKYLRTKPVFLQPFYKLLRCPSTSIAGQSSFLSCPPCSCGMLGDEIKLLCCSNFSVACSMSNKEVGAVIHLRPLLPCACAWYRFPVLRNERHSTVLHWRRSVMLKAWTRHARRRGCCNLERPGCVWKAKYKTNEAAFSVNCWAMGCIFRSWNTLPRFAFSSTTMRWGFQSLERGWDQVWYVCRQRLALRTSLTLHALGEPNQGHPSDRSPFVTARKTCHETGWRTSSCFYSQDRRPAELMWAMSEKCEICDGKQ